MTRDGQIWECERCGSRHFKSNVTRGELPRGWANIYDEEDTVKTVCPRCNTQYREILEAFFNEYKLEVTTGE